MSMRNIILFTCSVIFLAGCATKEVEPTKVSPKTESAKSNELLMYPQNVDFLSKNITPQAVMQEDFTYRYYSPWFRSTIKHSKENAMWGQRSYSLKNRYYGENLQLIPNTDIDTVSNNTNFEQFATINQHAIMTQNAQMRNLPTIKPYFHKTTLPGEGFPFDNLQNSRINVNEPLLISHYSKDGAWAFIESSFSIGWVPINTLVPIDARERIAFIRAEKIALTKDNIALYSDKQKFMTYAKIGSIFPVTGEDEQFFTSYMYKDDANDNAFKITLRIPKAYAGKLPLSFNQENITSISTELLGEKYGWGGYLENRDCSAMTRDFLAPFAIWVPRNSGAQKSFGTYLSLKDLTTKEKEEMILKNGIAFLSLIYLKGHIMLYAGEFEGKAMVMHNAWGIKTMENGKEGRNIIGKAVVSDLYIGENQPYVKEGSLLISRVEGILVKPANTKSNNLTLKYPAITAIKDNTVFFTDGTSLPYDDKKEKTFDEKLENADIEDQFAQIYPAFAPIAIPAFNEDPGRFRNEPLFKKLYGSSKSDIEKNLTTINWLPNHRGKKIQFNKNQNASAQLQKVSDELDKLPEEYMKYLKNVAGTYYYRKIAGTSRLSAHSFGIAIDIDTKFSSYWGWDKTYKYKNEIPQAIVDIFEKYGFAWGGRWYHYDTMHFEYRPELFESID